MVVCRYEISVLVLKSTSHSLAALATELSSQTLEEKFSFIRLFRKYLARYFNVTIESGNNRL